MIVHKYLKKEHLKNFKKSGLIRIGTLYDFRKIENNSLKDALEGKRIIKISAQKKPLELSEGEFNKLLPSLNNNERNRENVTISLENNTQFKMKVANAYIFCTSMKLHSSLYQRFNCDAHYSIHKPREFAQILFNKLMEEKKIIRCYEVRSVRYVRKPTILTEKNMKNVLLEKNETFWDTCFSKPKSFNIDQELRMVFVPESKEIKPLILKCPELKKCCKF